ncbi:MAG: response regulator [Deltaproteobacteria bacterium]|nr:response regulator [Deltaproteobacteria bacterium]
MSKILIFESDHAFAVELRTELSVLGCTVQVFKEGATGLTAASEGVPNLILVSADLRPMNGFSICNKLKKDPRLERVPVILMSADQSEETFEQHRKLRTRADDYVRKPLPMPELVARIRALIPLAGLSALGATRIVDDGPRPQPGAAQLRLDMQLEPRMLPSLEADSVLTGVHVAMDPKPEPARFLDVALLDDVADEEATRAGGEPYAPSVEPPPAPLAGAPRAGGLVTTQILEERLPSEPPPSADAESIHEDEYEGATSVVDVSSALSQASRVAPLPPPRAPTASSPALPEPRAPMASRPLISEPRAPLAPAPPGSEPLGAMPLLAPTSEPFAASAPLGLDVGDATSSSAVVQLRQALMLAHQELQRLRPQVTELSRARAEISDLRRELAVARESSSAESERASDGLREKLHRTEEEVVALRDEANQRHRELLEARAQASVHQRELIELRDARLAFEQRAAEAIARLDAVHADKALAERAVEDWRENHRKLAEQLEHLGRELRARKAEHETELERSSLEREEFVLKLEERLRRELTSGDEQHASVVSSLEARLAAMAAEAATRVERLQSAHAEAVGLLEEGFARRLAHALEAPSAELASLGARHAAELTARDAEHARAIERLRAEHAEALQRREARGATDAAPLQAELAGLRGEVEALARRIEELEEELALTERQRAHSAGRVVDLEREIGRAREEADAALRSGDVVAAERAAWQLAEEDARRQREALEARLASIDADHAAALGKALDTHREELQQQAAMVAEREQAHELETAEQVGLALAEAEAQRAKLASELAALTDERDEATHSAQSRAARIGELERVVVELGRAVQEREERARQIEAEAAAARADAEAALRAQLARSDEARLQELAAAEERRRAERDAYDVQLVRLRGDLDAAQAGLQRARERWSEDRVALQKARDAITSLIAASERDE